MRQASRRCPRRRCAPAHGKAAAPAAFRCRARRGVRHHTDGVPPGFYGVRPLLLIESDTMNKNQVKGTIKDAAGKVQEAAGKAVGSNEQQAKGLKKQVVGQAQKAVGDLQAVVKDGVNRPR